MKVSVAAVGGIVLTVALALGLAVAWRAEAAEHLEATVTGSNTCLGCSLKTDFCAGAQCSIYGHKHSLRVTKAVAGGREVPEMNGWVLHYLETDMSQDLINKHHGENLTVTGRVYPNERVLEAVSFDKAAEK